MPGPTTSLLTPNKPRIYLDHNATTAPHPEVVRKLPMWLESWGNPSSIHWEGRGPKTLLREVRQKVSKVLNVHPLEVIFTSGASESNNTVLKGAWDLLGAGSRKKIVSTTVEHPSVAKTLLFLESQGAEVIYIPVSRDGHLDLNKFKEAVDQNTLIVSVMTANNETGNLFPIKELCDWSHAQGALFHTDAVQALGRKVLDLHSLGVDYASFSGHKFYALKGIGLLYVKRGSPFQNLILGGGQERARRGGTENLLSIASLGEVCSLADEIPRAMERMGLLRDQLESKILSEISGVSITGARAPRVPNTSSLVLKDVDGESLLMNLDMKGFAVSTGAACSSGNPEPSPVLLAMGLTREEAQSSLRVALGWSTTISEIEEFVNTLKSVVERLRSLKPLALENRYGS